MKKDFYLHLQKVLGVMRTINYPHYILSEVKSKKRMRKDMKKCKSYKDRLFLKYLYENRNKTFEKRIKRILRKYLI